MPEEIVALIIVAIACGTAITILKTILAHQRKSGTRGNEESSLTTSQLERMMERAARRAMAPFEERLGALEDRTRAALPPKGERIELEEEEEEEVEAESTKLVSRTPSANEPAMEPRRRRSR